MTTADAWVAFLNARVDEAEAAAKAAADADGADWFLGPAEDDDERIVLYNGPSTLRSGGTWDYPVTGRVSVGTADHIALHDPAHVLREVAAKRAIIAEHTRDPEAAYGKRGHMCGSDGYSRNDCRTLRLLAAVYSDHPDYPQD